MPSAWFSANSIWRIHTTCTPFACPIGWMDATWLTATGERNVHEELGHVLATGGNAGTACRAHWDAATGGAGRKNIMMSVALFQILMHEAVYPKVLGHLKLKILSCALCEVANVFTIRKSSNVCFCVSWDEASCINCYRVQLLKLTLVKLLRVYNSIYYDRNKNATSHKAGFPCRSSSPGKMVPRQLKFKGPIATCHRSFWQLGCINRRWHRYAEETGERVGNYL